MVIVFGTDDGLCSRAHAALAPMEAIRIVRRWPDVGRAAPSAACCVVAVAWMHRDDAAREFWMLRHRSPTTPLVLVTSRDADNLRALRHTTVEEIVWPHEIESDLRGAVSRARDRGPLHRIGNALDTAVHLPPRLRTALRDACRADRVPATVDELAALSGCDRSTLWLLWRRATEGAGSIRLKDFIDGLLLIRAVARKSPGHAWSAVAADLRVHEHTLTRIARRLTGRSLHALSAASAHDCIRTIAVGLLEPLLRSEIDV